MREQANDILSGLARFRVHLFDMHARPLQTRVEKAFLSHTRGPVGGGQKRHDRDAGP